MFLRYTAYETFTFQAKDLWLSFIDETIEIIYKAVQPSIEYSLSCRLLMIFFFVRIPSIIHIYICKFSKINLFNGTSGSHVKSFCQGQVMISKGITDHSHKLQLQKPGKNLLKAHMKSFLYYKYYRG